MLKASYQNRKNITTVWNPGDSLENYKPMNLYGSPNYSISDISYTFNSNGFRCDDFTEVSDYPVVFMGCSYTEGIGVPLHEMWVTHVINRLRKERPGTKIPIWNLGMGGTSIDFAARTLVEFAPILRPKYIFYLLTSVHRREFLLNSDKVQSWFPNHSRMYKPSAEFSLMNHLFSNEYYAFYHTHISLLLLQQTAKLSNTKIFIFDLRHDADSAMKDKLFSNLENIEYFELPRYSFKDITALKLALPDDMSHLKNSPVLARDNQHPGAVWHYTISEKIWDIIKDKII